MKIGDEKWFHGVCGLVVAFMVSCVVASMASTSPWAAYVAGLLSALALGIGKESDNLAHGFRCDGYNFLSILIGGLIGAFAGFLV